jgi:hypothetical protein
MGARGLPVGSFSGVTGMVTPLSSSLFRSLLSNRHPAYGLMVTTTPLQLMTVPRLNVPVCVPVTLTNFASVIYLFGTIEVARYGDMLGSIAQGCDSLDNREGVYSEWRREWDSNPRLSFPNTRFPSVLLKPLGHLSAPLRVHLD